MKLQLDISTGDPVTPAPQRITFPTLREVHPAVTILGYPMPVVLAEKLCTAIDLSAAAGFLNGDGDVDGRSIAQDGDVLVEHDVNIGDGFETAVVDGTVGDAAQVLLPVPDASGRR